MIDTFTFAVGCVAQAVAIVALILRVVNEVRVPQAVSREHALALSSTAGDEMGVRFTKARPTFTQPLYGGDKLPSPTYTVSQEASPTSAKAHSVLRPLPEQNRKLSL
ncbi:hypothetical protein DIPPA_01235 [Diplonema papillatum]|nr:hypothetical protein DIPPA_15232 [Diplonema papillatum]KAJ9438758.1 hypothetical protein DIPPA_01235 [Diplonema papillatum]